MNELPLVVIAEHVHDEVPQGLPLTCLRHDESEACWWLKTATENGLRKTRYPCEDWKVGFTNALETYGQYHHLMVGPLVLCLDNRSFFGLDKILAEAFPQGHEKRFTETVVFPWSTEPK